MDNIQTYRWFTTHDTYVGRGEYYSTDDRGIFSETHPGNIQKSLEPLGILDKVPTFENFKPLIDMYTKWWVTVEESWSNYEKEKGSHLVSLHWILGRILQHPNIDPKILKYVVETSPKNIISVVYNPNVPEDLLVEILNMNSKKDPTKGTKGGEIGCFILHNKNVSGKVLDLVSRKTKKVTIQRDVVGHPNVSRETLVFLSKEGKNPNVKKDALEKLVDKGWLNVV